MASFLMRAAAAFLAAAAALGANGGSTAGGEGGSMPDTGSLTEPVIDYREMPAHFMVPVELGTQYTLIDGEGTEIPFSFSVTEETAGQERGVIRIVYGEQTKERDMINAEDRSGYLVHVDGLDLFELYDAERNGSLNVFKLTDRYISNTDNSSFGFDGIQTDPDRIRMFYPALCIGRVMIPAEFHPHPDTGVMTMNDLSETGGFIYVTGEYAEKVLTLRQSVEAEVIDEEKLVPNPAYDADSGDADGMLKQILVVTSHEETFARGAEFTRWRTDDSGIVDLRAEDGRIVRFYESELFSEPEAYHMVNGVANAELFKGLD